MKENLKIKVIFGMTDVRQLEGKLLQSIIRDRRAFKIILFVHSLIKKRYTFYEDCSNSQLQIQHTNASI